MITFQNVTKNYSSNVGLDNVSVHIDKGDFVFLVGPSGAGKSTFIKLILKEINADRGTIVAAGMNVTKLSNREVPLLRRKIGMVFQDFRLLPKKTVYENVAFAMEILHKSKRQIRKRVPQILSLVGISDKADQYPDELSAGEQQRVAIARAIVNNPTMLIADEPTGNLDPDTAWEIMDLLNQINMTGTTIVMVTHAKEIVDKMGKRVVAIDHGKIVRDEFGAYGFEQENVEDLEEEEAEFKEEMYAAEEEDTEVDFDEIAVDDYEIEEAEEEAEPVEVEVLEEATELASEEAEVEAEESALEDAEVEAEEPVLEEAQVEAEEDTEESDGKEVEAEVEAEVEEPACEVAEEEPDVEETEEETEVPADEIADAEADSDEATEDIKPVDETEEALIEEAEGDETSAESEADLDSEEVESEEDAEEEVAEETEDTEEAEEAAGEEAEEAETKEETTEEIAEETEADEEDFHKKLEALKNELFAGMAEIKATHTAQDERMAAESTKIETEKEGQ